MYLPEVDGLRFVALFMVVCIAHIPNFLNKIIFDHQMITSVFWQRVSLDGVFGVFFFFIISGFVLGIGFGKSYLIKNNSPDFRKYFLRRLIRIEPPYLIALFFFFLILVFVVHKYSFNELLPHLITSIFYVHNPVYHTNSLIVPVAWTLETEIQFYLIAPFLAQLYRIKNRKLRWSIFLFLILVDTIYWYNIYKGTHVIKFLHYFLWGMLLADLYLEKIKLPISKRWGAFLGIVATLAIPFVIGYDNLTGYILKNALMVIAFYLVISNEVLKKIFSTFWIAIIGGMCYSIYLVHEQIMSATGRLFSLLDTEVSILNCSLYFSVLIISILLFSSIFYLLVEKPFMSWKISGKNEKDP